MIYVIASIHIKEGRKMEFIDIFKANIPQVLAEKGCIEYAPTVDVPTGLAAQELNADVVTIVEKWDDLDALRAHMAAPHMQAYQKKVKDIVEKVTLRVLERA
ncbi:putative quinol monooxygenase [Desulfocastanea catecholica]